MFGKKKNDKKNTNKKSDLPKVKKTDANGEKQSIPKGYKATVSNEGTIIMVSKTTGLSGKKSGAKTPKTAAKPAADSKSKMQQRKSSSITPKQAAKQKVSRKPEPERIKHSDKYERGTDEGKPIIIKKISSKRSNRKELRKVAKNGGYTVFDGPRAGKTFETPKEAAEYAADLLKETGVLYKIEKTDRQISHSYKAENHSQNK